MEETEILARLEKVREEQDEVLWDPSILREEEIALYRDFLRWVSESDEEEHGKVRVRARTLLEGIRTIEEGEGR